MRLCHLPDVSKGSAAGWATGQFSFFDQADHVRPVTAVPGAENMPGIENDRIQTARLNSVFDQLFRDVLSPHIVDPVGVSCSRAVFCESDIVETPGCETGRMNETAGLCIDCGLYHIPGTADIDPVLLIIVAGPYIGTGCNVEYRVYAMWHGIADRSGVNDISKVNLHWQISDILH